MLEQVNAILCGTRVGGGGVMGQRGSNGGRVGRVGLGGG